MVFKFISDLKNCERGITLVEIIVVIFIITLFSSILISDFPKMQKHFALSRATYQLAQDLRKTQDLGLSGVQTKDMAGNPISVKGYGIYVNPTESTTQYIIYADVPNVNGIYDQKYDGDISSVSLCSDTTSPTSDCALEVVDLSKSNAELYIKDINNIDDVFTSINFSPPSPTINLDNLCQFCQDNLEVGIVLGLTSDDSSERTVWINTSGLIRVQ